MIVKEITKKIMYFDNIAEQKDYINIMEKKGYIILTRGFNGEGCFITCIKEEF